MARGANGATVGGGLSGTAGRPPSILPRYDRDLLERFGRRLDMFPEDALAYVKRFADALDVPFGATFATNPSWPSGKRVVQWGPARRRNGSPRLLTLANLTAHLLGDYSIAVARERWTRLLIIDIDAKTVEDSGTVNVRRWQVEDALNNAPYFVVQSSGSGGQHMLYFLDRKHPSAQLRTSILSALRGAGIEPSRCSLEVFPHGRRMLRLPLGAGSLPIDDLECRPLAGSISRRRISRDVARGVMLLLDFAENTRVTLQQLTGADSPRGHHCSDEQGVINIRGKGHQGRELGHSAPRISSPPGENAQTDSPVGKRTVYTASEYHQQLAACEDGVSEYGRRYAEAQLRLWDAVVRRGLSPDDALAEFRAWLFTGNHHSKDLSRQPAVTIRHMLRDAARHVEHLRCRIQAGKLRIGTDCRAHGEPFGSLAHYLEEARRRAGNGWRELARKQLSHRDHELLDSLKDNWLTARVGLLLGLLRFGAHIDGVKGLVTVAASAMQAIAGRKSPPHRFRRRQSVNPKATGPSAYTVVERCAEQLKIITYEAAPIISARARTFRIQLPDCSHDPPPQSVRS